MVFLPGTHYLSKVSLTLTNVKNFTMSSTAQIKCTNDSSMHFSYSRSICISNLQFSGCGGNQVKHVEEFLVNNTKFKGQANSGTALELTANLKIMEQTCVELYLHTTALLTSLVTYHLSKTLPIMAMEELSVAEVVS